MFVIALSMGLAFTITQMINKVAVAIQKTHLYNQTILEWNEFADAEKNMSATEGALCQGVQAPSWVKQ